MRWLPFLLLAACAPLEVDRFTRLVAEDMLTSAALVLQYDEHLKKPPALKSRLLAASVDSGLPSIVEVIHPPTKCDTHLVWLRSDQREPIVYANARCNAGDHFHAIFRHAFVHRDGPVPRPAWLLLSLAPPGDPVSLDSWGAPGCWLMVNLDLQWLHVLQPDGVLLVATPGRLTLHWDVPASLAGLDFWAQMLWWEPGANAANHLVSPLLHVRVGR